MSAYSRVSKEIGWEQKKVPLPTLERAQQLIEQAKNGQEHAFKELFRIYRFAGTPETEAGLALINVIFRGFNDAAMIFRELE